MPKWIMKEGKKRTSITRMKDLYSLTQLNEVYAAVYWIPPAILCSQVSVFFASIRRKAQNPIEKSYLLSWPL